MISGFNYVRHTNLRSVKDSRAQCQSMTLALTKCFPEADFDTFFWYQRPAGQPKIPNFPGPDRTGWKPGPGNVLTNVRLLVH